MKIFTILLLLFQTTALLSQTSLEQIDLNNGDYTVGFKHYVTADNTRTYQRVMDWDTKKIARPISVSMWYPSEVKPAASKALKVLDYMQILKEEEEWEYLPNELILNWFNYQNTVANQNHLTETTSAFSEIEMAKGSFPVLIYAASARASSVENFALCEFLASHGYIVIASPSWGTNNRFFEGGNHRDMETQARDIEFLIQEVSKYSAADLNNIATGGFSFGGLSNVLSQMRNDNIKAILSLDGSIRYQYKTLKESPFFKIENMDVPFIHMAQKNIPEEVLVSDKIDPKLNTEFDFYDDLKFSQAYKLRFHHLTHSYFSTMGVLFEARDTRQDKSDIEIMESYKWVSEYSLNFLNAFLKKDAIALQFLNNEPAKNGVAKNLISSESKSLDGKEMTFHEFNELAAIKNYKNLKEDYKKVKQTQPNFELAEGRLNNLGLQLQYNPLTSQQGIRVFDFAISLYPNSANLFDSLAEAHLFVNDNEKAIFNFEKSLQLNPENQNAINRLKELKR